MFISNYLKDVQMKAGLTSAPVGFAISSSVSNAPNQMIMS